MTAQLESILNAVNDEPRLLLEAHLRPVQGDRFQPTGFPDLGAALYRRLDDEGKYIEMLLVESAQSMANRMEKVCWDDTTNSIQPVLEGLPYFEVDLGEDDKTTSIQEPHRMASIYVLNSSRSNETQKFFDVVNSEAQLKKSASINIGKLAATVFKYDPNSLIHGVFFARSNMAGGRGRLQRLLSSFIEASGVEAAQSGGTLMQHIDPKGDDAYSRYTKTGKNKEENKLVAKAVETAGNVPFPLTEFVAKEIAAYFNIDFATLRGYRLGEQANRMVTALMLYKILRVLNGNLKLRTRCDFDVMSMTVTRPKGLILPDIPELLAEVSEALPRLISECNFGDAPVTHLAAPARNPKYTSRKEGRKQAAEDEDIDDTGSDATEDEDL